MGSIQFTRGKLIQTRLTVYGVDENVSRDLPVILDTGAARSLIPLQILLDLGYDLSKANEGKALTASGTEPMLIVNVSRLTAIDKTATNIEVACYKEASNIPEHLQSIGLLGFNFLSHFDCLGISFLKEIVNLN